MKKYKISLNDMDSNFFHFTWKSNLANIEKKDYYQKKDPMQNI